MFLSRCHSSLYVDFLSLLTFIFQARPYLMTPPDPRSLSPFILIPSASSSDDIRFDVIFTHRTLLLLTVKFQCCCLDSSFLINTKHHKISSLDRPSPRYMKRLSKSYLKGADIVQLLIPIIGSITYISTFRLFFLLFPLLLILSIHGCFTIYFWTYEGMCPDL